MLTQPSLFIVYRTRFGAYENLPNSVLVLLCSYQPPYHLCFARFIKCNNIAFCWKLSYWVTVYWKEEWQLCLFLLGFPIYKTAPTLNLVSATIKKEEKKKKNLPGGFISSFISAKEKESVFVCRTVWVTCLPPGLWRVYSAGPHLWLLSTALLCSWLHLLAPGEQLLSTRLRRIIIQSQSPDTLLQLNTMCLFMPFKFSFCFKVHSIEL